MNSPPFHGTTAAPRQSHEGGGRGGRRGGEGGVSKPEVGWGSGRGGRGEGSFDEPEVGLHWQEKVGKGRGKQRGQQGR